MCSTMSLLGVGVDGVGGSPSVKRVSFPATEEVGELVVEEDAEESVGVRIPLRLNDVGEGDRSVTIVCRRADARDQMLLILADYLRFDLQYVSVRRTLRYTLARV